MKKKKKEERKKGEMGEKRNGAIDDSSAQCFHPVLPRTS